MNLSGITDVHTMLTICRRKKASLLRRIWCAKHIQCNKLIRRRDIAPVGATKGLSDRPLETFGALVRENASCILGNVDISGQR